MTQQADHARCLRCGRKLTVSKGYGRVCRAKLVAAAKVTPLADYSQAQRDKAIELIADGGVIPTGHKGVFRTVGSSGNVFYLTTPDACNCPRGLRCSRCYHSAAATVVAASFRRAA